MGEILLDIEDSNMVGDAWTWTWSLDLSPDGKSYILIGEQSGEDFEPLMLDPVEGLKGGKDIYRALEGMMSEVGYSLQDYDIASIIENISAIDPKLAADFKKAPKALEREARLERQAKEQARDEKLAPFRSAIERYLLTVDDYPLRGGGMSYGTRRQWMKRFIEEFVLKNGHLPKGEHKIIVNNGGAGYSGGPHDFGNFDPP